MASTDVCSRDDPPQYKDFAVSASDIGNGNFSRVMRAVHRATKQAFALKVVDKAKAEKLRKRHPNIRNEILMEKEVLNRLKHPNVIRLYNTWSDATNLYFLLEFAPGQELWHRLTTTHNDAPVCIGLSAPLAAYFLFQVSLGLRACHAAGVLHRDLKPENVVLCPPRASPVQATADFTAIPASNAASSRVVAKLIDFGTAKDLLGGGLNGPEFVGTPEYIPPEVVSGGSATHAMDLWALGVLLFQCLAGYHPFGSGSPYMTMQRVRCGRLPLPLYLPHTAQDLLQKLLTPDPQARLGVWGVEGGGAAPMDAVLRHPFWDSNPRRSRLASALHTLALKLFPDTNADEAVPTALQGAASASGQGVTGGAAAAGDGAKVPPPAPPRAAPATWPAPPGPDTTWSTVQRMVQTLLEDDVLNGMIQLLHANTPLHPPPPPPEDKAPPPDPDTTVEGSSECLADAVAAIGLERWLHWWAQRSAVQALPPATRQWVRHQLALRGELWSLPVLGLFAPASVCNDGDMDVILRAQRCLSWARVQRSGLHPKRFRLSTPPSGAAAQHDNFTAPFSLAVVRCTAAGAADGAAAALAAATSAGPAVRLRGVAFILQQPAETEQSTGTPFNSLDDRVLQAVSCLPLNVQCAVVAPGATDVTLDGDEERTWNTEWILHGTRMCFWSPTSMQHPLEYAWWSDALDSSKYCSRHHVVVELQGALAAQAPLHKRAFLSAKRLLHHTSNTRAVVSCVQAGTGVPAAAGTLHTALAAAAPHCAVDDGTAEEISPSAGEDAPHIITAHGALTWEALDADDAEHGQSPEGWATLLPESREGPGGGAAGSESDSEDENAVSKRIPVHCVELASVTLLHFSQDAVSVAPVQG